MSVVIYHNPDCGTSRNDAMLEHPVLVNRPIVCSPKGVRLCRPSEAVLDLLQSLPTGPMEKEDGSPLIDAEGNRVD